MRNSFICDRLYPRQKPAGRSRAGRSRGCCNRRSSDWPSCPGNNRTRSRRSDRGSGSICCIWRSLACCSASSAFIMVLEESSMIWSQTSRSRSRQSIWRRSRTLVSSPPMQGLATAIRQAASSASCDPRFLSCLRRQSPITATSFAAGASACAGNGRAMISARTGDHR